MQLSEESLRKFMAIYEEEIGEDLSLAEAREMATRLVTLYALLARPLPSEGVKKD